MIAEIDRLKAEIHDLRANPKHIINDDQSRRDLFATAVWIATIVAYGKPPTSQECHELKELLHLPQADVQRKPEDNHD